MFDRFVAEFGRGRAFKDVDSIGASVDFRKAIEQAITGSEVIIGVLGPTWLTATDENGTRRIDDVKDFVRLELESALRLGKHMIPVLLGAATMPHPGELLATLKELIDRQARPVRPDPDFHRDVDRVIHQVKRLHALGRHGDARFTRGALECARFVLLPLGGLIRDDHDEGSGWDGPLFVVVDGKSAGAAEFFAGLIKG
jgi:hypothetical protein